MKGYPLGWDAKLTANSQMNRANNMERIPLRCNPYGSQSVASHSRIAEPRGEPNRGMECSDGRCLLGSAAYFVGLYFPRPLLHSWTNGRCFEIGRTFQSLSKLVLIGNMFVTSTLDGLSEDLDPWRHLSASTDLDDLGDSARRFQPSAISQVQVRLTPAEADLPAAGGLDGTNYPRIDR